jgi:hypothetical protein
MPPELLGRLSRQAQAQHRDFHVLGVRRSSAAHQAKNLA